MRVFKFGGASVKDATSVRNLAEILKMNYGPLVIVISAMGKTTNAMEKLLKSYFGHKNDTKELYNEVFQFHYSIAMELFPAGSQAFVNLDEIFGHMLQKLHIEPSVVFNYEYDQLVPFGELISTLIVKDYLIQCGIDVTWIDIRKVLKTDENYREANVEFEISAKLSQDTFVFTDSEIYLTQGFIGSTLSNLTTTLGREGSDYTAALLASFLKAESVTVWKDVPGVLNADPKWFDDTVKLEKITYTDAIELAFYGASVLHPKTIQPVKQNQIPLYVKSFVNPKEEGTVIGNFSYDQLVPCFIFKVDQVLIQIHPPDLSFISEHHLERIFQILAIHGLRVNLMQNTAISFKICVNNDSTRIPPTIDELKKHYRIALEENLELITIRYYDQKTINRVLVKKEVLLEQHTEQTVQMVVRKVE